MGKGTAVMTIPLDQRTVTVTLPWGVAYALLMRALWEEAASPLWEPVAAALGCAVGQAAQEVTR